MWLNDRIFCRSHDQCKFRWLRTYWRQKQYDSSFLSKNTFNLLAYNLPAYLTLFLLIYLGIVRLLAHSLKWFLIKCLNSCALRARWFKVFAGPRRERKGFLVAFDIRSRSYSTRRCCTINSSARFRPHERSKYQVGALLNGCQHPFGSEDDKGLEQPAVGNR